MVSNLSVSADAKTLLTTLIEGDGLLTWSKRCLAFESNGIEFIEDDFQRWGLAVDELLRLSMIERTTDGTAFELTRPGTKSGVMYLEFLTQSLEEDVVEFGEAN